MDRKSFPQLGHRHLYIAFTEFFLFRGAGSSRRNGSGSVSNPSSTWEGPKASLEYLGLASGCGGEGAEMLLFPLQCPLVVLLPLSETSPLSFQESQAVWGAGTLLSVLGGLCRRGLQDKLVKTIAAIISSISTASDLLLGTSMLLDTDLDAASVEAMERLGSLDWCICTSGKRTSSVFVEVYSFCSGMNTFTSSSTWLGCSTKATHSRPSWVTNTFCPGYSL